MKLDFAANRRGKQSKFGAFIDSSLWSSLPKRVQILLKKYRIRMEAKTLFNPETKKVKREFYTLRAFVGHCYYGAKNLVFNLPPFPSFPSFLAPVLRRSFGAIAYDATANSGSQTNTDPWSWSHTCTGSDLVLSIGISLAPQVPVTVSSVVYNSVALTVGVTRTNTDTNTIRAELWYLANPTTGANTATVDFTTGSYGGAGSISMSGCNTSSPVDATASNKGAGTSGSTTITTNNANSMIAENFGGTNNVLGFAVSGSGQTSRWIIESGNTQSNCGSNMTTTTAGGYTPGWTWTTSQSWAEVVMAINEAAAAATFIPQIIMK